MNHIEQESQAGFADPVVLMSIILGILAVLGLAVIVLWMIKRLKRQGALLILWNGARSGFVDFIKVLNPEADYVKLENYKRFKGGPDVVLDRKLAAYDRSKNRLVYMADPVSGLLYDISPASVDNNKPGWMDGRRLRGIRKDHRVAQIVAPMTEGWLNVLLKYTPLFMIVVIILLLLLMGMFASGMGWL